MGLQATQSPLGLVGSLTVDSQGSVYFAEGLSTNYDQVFKITPAGVIELIAGTASSYSGDAGDGGPASQALFASIAGIACDSSGNVYIADSIQGVVRRVSASTGVIEPFAGSGQKSGYAGDGGPAANALLSRPYGLAIDQSNNIYIADTENSAIRKIDVAGMISTVVGNGTAGSVQNGQAAGAAFIQPYSVVVDSGGNLYATSLNSFLPYEIAEGVVNQLSATGPTPTGTVYFAPDAVESSGGLFQGSCVMVALLPVSLEWESG